MIIIKRKQDELMDTIAKFDDKTAKTSTRMIENIIHRKGNILYACTGLKAIKAEYTGEGEFPYDLPEGGSKIIKRTKSELIIDNAGMSDSDDFPNVEQVQVTPTHKVTYERNSYSLRTGYKDCFIRGILKELGEVEHYLPDDSLVTLPECESYQVGVAPSIDTGSKPITFFVKDFDKGWDLHCTYMIIPVAYVDIEAVGEA